MAKNNKIRQKHKMWDNQTRTKADKAQSNVSKALHKKSGQKNSFLQHST